MYYKSKKISLLILLLTAIICSVVITFLFDDLANKTFAIGLGIAAIVYFLSLGVYLFNSSNRPSNIMNQSDPTGLNVLEHLSLVSLTGFKRLLFVILIQIVLTGGFFLYLN